MSNISRSRDLGGSNASNSTRLGGNSLAINIPTTTNNNNNNNNDRLPHHHPAAENFANNGRVNASDIVNIRCLGKAKEALEAYRRRERELREQPVWKPDMKAFKELRRVYTPERRHGELEGVPIGLMVRSRGEAAILGIHQSILRGIDAIQGQPCYAVCISGGYADDDDDSDPDGAITYTGEGGQEKERQVRDQSWSSYGNRALLKSIDSNETIRVVRGNNPNYYYLGLYRYVSYKYEEGKDGFKVFKFKLVPQFKNQCGALRKIPLQPKRKASSSASPRSPKAKAASKTTKKRSLEGSGATFPLVAAANRVVITTSDGKIRTAPNPFPDSRHGNKALQSPNSPAATTAYEKPIPRKKKRPDSMGK